MKKIMKLCMIGFLAISLIACGSSDEKKAKAVVSDYLSALKDKDLAQVAEISGETYDNSQESDDTFKRKMNVMLDRFDYDITDASINGDDAAVTVDVSNINYTNFYDSTKSMVANEVENFDSLEVTEKDLKLLELQEKLLPDTDIVTQTITVYLTRDGEGWKLAPQNAELNKAIFGQ